MIVGWSWKKVKLCCRRCVRNDGYLRHCERKRCNPGLGSSILQDFTVQAIDSTGLTHITLTSHSLALAPGLLHFVRNDS